MRKWTAVAAIAVMSLVGCSPGSKEAARSDEAQQSTTSKYSPAADARRRSKANAARSRAEGAGKHRVHVTPEHPSFLVEIPLTAGIPIAWFDYDEDFVDRGSGDVSVAFPEDEWIDFLVNEGMAATPDSARQWLTGNCEVAKFDGQADRSIGFVCDHNVESEERSFSVTADFTARIIYTASFGEDADTATARDFIFEIDQPTPNCEISWILEQYRNGETTIDPQQCPR